MKALKITLPHSTCMIHFLQQLLLTILETSSRKGVFLFNQIYMKITIDELLFLNIAFDGLCFQKYRRVSCMIKSGSNNHEWVVVYNTAAPTDYINAYSIFNFFCISSPLTLSLNSRRSCQEKYNNPRGRDLAMVRTLALCHNAIAHAKWVTRLPFLLSCFT